MHYFDREIELTEVKTFLLEADVSSRLSHRNILNGGLQLALAFKAMSVYARKPGSLLITASYLSVCKAGKIRMEVEPLASTGNFDRLEVKLRQGENDCLRAFGTFASNENSTVEFPGPEQPGDIAPEKECIELAGSSRTPIFDAMEVKLDPECAGWMEGRLQSEAVQKGWIRFRERRSFDMPAAIMATDCLPPPVIAVRGLVQWIPTIELSVQVRTVYPVDVLSGYFRTRYMTGTILEEDGVLRTPDGHLVALSRQTAVYRPNQGKTEVSYDPIP